MGIEIIIVGGIFLFIVIMAIFLLQPKKREMTGAEKMAYESERGRIQAGRDMEREGRSIWR